jgi:hypothetical protein
MSHQQPASLLDSVLGKVLLAMYIMVMSERELELVSHHSRTKEYCPSTCEAIFNASVARLPKFIFLTDKQSLSHHKMQPNNKY